jgi:hypothetical protein
LRVGVEVRAHASGNVALGGGFVHVDVGLSELATLRLGGSAGAARATHPLGEVDVLQLLGSVGLSLGARIGIARLAMTPALELGWGRVKARSDVPSVIVGDGDTVIVGARLDLEASLAVVGRLELFVGLGAGYPIRGLRALAMGTAFAGITGPSVQMLFGLGARLG